jgi:predicted CXXCH cytochrome family protein
MSIPFKTIFRKPGWLVFGIMFIVSLLAGASTGLAQPAQAAPQAAPVHQTDAYAGSEACSQCHASTVEVWKTTRHALAFSSPVFQKDWVDQGSATSCLACHTTGYDAKNGSYAEEGIGCESCHGQFQPGHPGQLMPIKPDADLCSTCHKQTTDEWKASPHSAAGVQCQSCHNPHSQTPKAASITELCGNCHKERGDSFTHGTHANAGLECSNCHMYHPPREGNPIMGLVPTGHTFSVGSETCIGCHQDTVHTRDTIVQLTGGQAIPTPDTEELQQVVHQQEEEITSLEARSSIRLYTGLAQGAIVGLVTGGAAAWVVSRRITVVEDDEDGKKKES